MKQKCSYSLEELLPITMWLAECSNGIDSTSVTYEKAEQLMEAVIYCIGELESNTGDLLGTGMTAEEAYKSGYHLVKEKVQAALAEYNEMMPFFYSYGNRCLQDTFVNGIPEFFKRYDARFTPQETILTLDYPVPADLHEKEGIDRIAEYIHAVSLEQKFLRSLPETYVENCLTSYAADFEELVENLCGIVLEKLVGQVLFRSGCRNEIEKGRRTEWVEQVIGKTVEQTGEEGGEMYRYLCRFAKDIAVRLWMSEK